METGDESALWLTMVRSSVLLMEIEYWKHKKLHSILNEC